MVLHRYGSRLYAGMEAALTAHLRGIARDLEGLSGGRFLSELLHRWAAYHKSTQMIRDILMVRGRGVRRGWDALRLRWGLVLACDCGSHHHAAGTRYNAHPVHPRPLAQYMDRTYVHQLKKTTVYDRGMQLWTAEIVRHARIGPLLRGLLLDEVARERAGEAVNRGVLRSVTKMLLELGTDVYLADFEAPFLEASTQYFRCGRVGGRGGLQRRRHHVERKALAAAEGRGCARRSSGSQRC